MTRAVRAVLIAVPDTTWARGQTFRAAIPAVESLGGFSSAGSLLAEHAGPAR